MPWMGRIFFSCVSSRIGRNFRLREGADILCFGYHEQNGFPAGQNFRPAIGELTFADVRRGYNLW